MLLNIKRVLRKTMISISINIHKMTNTSIVAATDFFTHHQVADQYSRIAFGQICLSMKYP